MQMAVFLVNNCKFNGCGLTFTTLAELIQHIEETHIDSDPRNLEKQELQQPTSLALSYVLRFFTDAAKRENAELVKKMKRAQSPASSLRSTTPTGSEFDEDEVGSEDEDSDDSWTTQEEFTSDLILSMMNNKDGDGEKPFACPVPGCKKRYKNVNGIKYHAKHGHRKDARVKKAYKCKCGKSYKTPQGLKNHALTNHSQGEIIATVTQNQLQRANLAAVAAQVQAAQTAHHANQSAVASALHPPSQPSNMATTASLPQSTTSSQINHPSPSTNTTTPHNPLPQSVLSQLTQSQQVITTLSNLNIPPQTTLSQSQHYTQHIQVPVSLSSLSQNGVASFQQVPVSALQSSQLSQVLAAANPNTIVTANLEQPVATQ